MSKLKTNTIQHTGGSADNITLDNSQNVTVEGNATVDGTSTLTGNVTASGKVGIGETSPSTLLNLKGTSGGGVTGIKIVNTANEYTALEFDANRSGANSALAIIRAKWDGNENAAIYMVSGSDTTNKDDGEIVLQTRPSGGSITERMRIDSNGSITTPNQPCFAAKGAASWIDISTGDENVDMPCGVELFDNGSNYNTSTYTFTAPVAGKYAFFAQMYLKFDSASGYFNNYFTKNNSSGQETHQIWGYGTLGDYQDQTKSASAIIELAANDYVRYRIRTVGGDAEYYGGHCTFSGYLIG